MTSFELRHRVTCSRVGSVSKVSPVNAWSTPVKVTQAAAGFSYKSLCYAKVKSEQDASAASCYHIQ